MKFTDSPVIDLQVLNSHLSFHQDNGSMHVGTSVWSCSLVLVKFAERWHPSTAAAGNNNPYADLLNFTGKRGIELGAGCGVGSMGLFLLGLNDIVVTDIAPVMPALKHNLKRNKPVLKKALKTAHLYWANEAQMKALGPHPFDVVVAADVVYIEESVGPLVETMVELVAEDGVVLLGYQVRSPEAHLLFWEKCGEVFEIEKIPHEHLHPEYAYEETDVYVLRKKKQNSVENKKAS
ncbi:EEF1A lysine methyltransferase 3-like [Coffea eugenioides]|uniref:EEF1A lysine methyltransferase 3-like n=1 Tax=Coffea eugenioides TaxID=49369 RepID=UPI000F606E23|nr:EEF1A lysine methyltransferase 3-like [Coffea eugenioides]